MKNDSRVKAIRNNDRVGDGSLTNIEMCWTAEELVEKLDEEKITTDKAAVEWAIQLEGLLIENATNFRLGNDDDPEILRLQEWEAGN